MYKKKCIFFRKKCLTTVYTRVYYKYEGRGDGKDSTKVQ